MSAQDWVTSHVPRFCTSCKSDFISMTHQWRTQILVVTCVCTQGHVTRFRSASTKRRTYTVHPPHDDDKSHMDFHIKQEVSLDFSPAEKKLLGIDDEESDTDEDGDDDGESDDDNNALVEHKQQLSSFTVGYSEMSMMLVATSLIVAAGGGTTSRAISGFLGINSLAKTTFARLQTAFFAAVCDVAHIMFTDIAETLSKEKWVASADGAWSHPRNARMGAFVVYSVTHNMIVASPVAVRSLLARKKDGSTTVVVRGNFPDNLSSKAMEPKLMNATWSWLREKGALKNMTSICADKDAALAKSVADV